MFSLLNTTRNLRIQFFKLRKKYIIYLNSGKIFKILK